MTLTLIIIGWIACGVLAYGITLAGLQAIWSKHEWANEAFRNDHQTALVAGMMGVIGLVASFSMFDFARHGLMYRNPNRKES